MKKEKSKLVSQLNPDCANQQLSIINHHPSHLLQVFSKTVKTSGNVFTSHDRFLHQI